MALPRFKFVSEGLQPAKVKIYMDGRPLPAVIDYHVDQELLHLPTVTIKFRASEVLMETGDRPVEITSHSSPGAYREFAKGSDD